MARQDLQRKMKYTLSNLNKAKGQRYSTKKNATQGRVGPTCTWNRFAKKATGNTIETNPYENLD